MDYSVFQNKKILITGHSGFKGSWLTLWLLRNGAQITGFALQAKTECDNYLLTGLSKKISEHIADIRDKEKLFKAFNEEQPEIVFHLAAQPLVIDGYKNPLYTFETNTLGTTNVLEAFRLTNSAKLLIVITTDKVYENNEVNRGYKEDDRLGGKDPYSASKASAELITTAYNESYFFSNPNKKVVTVRAGNVIGGGDWSENRIIPDCIKALENNKDIIIRNPSSTRPWQFVLEPLSGYLLLAAKILKGEDNLTGAWNFGPLHENNINVEALVKLLIDDYGAGKYVLKSETNKLKESNYLALDISKVMDKLKWKPCLNVQETIHNTIDWYKNYKEVNVFDFCNKQIDDYEKKWKSVNVS
ncbi:MAG: CDP-glucose 4,6-dehydratase [Syntrophothermus sp.]